MRYCSTGKNLSNFMTTISVTIITKNEALNIAECLKSVAWANEVIVIDSGSTDDTQNIAKKNGAKVFVTDWPGFGIQKNRALQNATCEWILSIDADERVTENLQNEILQTINNNRDVVAYKLPRQNFFLGKHVKHCFDAKSDAPIRLFKRSFAKFTDDVVHERVVVNGKISALKNSLQHFPFRDLTTLLNKANLYSTLGAEKLAKQNIKPTIFKAFSHGFWGFIRLYFLKLGFLDGWPGFIIALGNFEGTFYRYAKLLESMENSSQK